MNTPAAPVRRRLGDLVVEACLLQRDALERAAGEARSRHLRLGSFLVEHGWAEEREVWRLLAEQEGLPFLLLEDVAPRLQADAVRSMPRRFQEHEHVLVVERSPHHVFVVTSFPETRRATLTAALRVPNVELGVVTPTDFRRLLSLVDLDLGTPPQVAHPEVVERPDLLSRDNTSQTHVVAIWDTILLEAIAERASDIHLERYGHHTRLRLRVDGDLRELPRALTPDEARGLLNVIKVQANLDIAEHRLPQGGRASAQLGGRAFDLRVQTQPSLHGENVVVRLLPQTQRLLSIEDLGFPPDLAATYRRLLGSPQGLVLVVGPTGSGKSTTLYAGLQVLAADQTRKVLTAEDPIEYALDGIQQTQVRPDLGFSFDQAMRVFVRQDPDVILLGEIRDRETALEALRASQTGHLVLSTLHCNDAVDAVQRLYDLGMHPNSIASELLAVFAQRLGKRICEGCRQPHSPPPELLAEIFPRGVPTNQHFFKGQGCARCGNHGTHSRVGVVEHLAAGPALRRAISAQLPLDELRGVARSAGLTTLRDHALYLVDGGVMALEELPTFLAPEHLPPDHGPAPVPG
jgi:type IV pilus assembly protein PilB